MALLTIVVMLALHVPATSVQRDTRSWYQAYEEGRLAVGKSDAAAIASLEAAKRIGPKPGRNVNTYGDNFVKFNPDYYLGVAFLNQRRFTDAEAAFRRVQQAQLIGPKDSEYSAFTAQLSKASFEVAMNAAEQALAAGQLDQALKTVLQAPSTADRADSQRAKNLADKIEAAKTPAKNPTPTPVTPTPSPSTPAPSPTTSVPPTATPTPTPSPTAASTPTPTPTPRSPIAPRPTVAPSPSSQISALEQRGMALFFKGDYAGAVAQLRSVSGGPTPTARAYFYLACAEAGLVLTGQGDVPMLEEARGLYANANGNSGEFSADRRFISPSVLTLLGGKQ